MVLTIIAPWIVDSWHDALLALSFDIPVVKLDAYERHFAMAVIALLLLTLFWHSVAVIPRRARWTARLLMGVALVSPATAFVSVHLNAIASLPKFSGRVRIAPPAQAVAKTPFIIKPQPLPAATGLSETKLAASKHVTEAKTETTTQASRPSVTLAIEPPLTAPELPSNPEPTTARVSPSITATATLRNGLRSLQQILPSGARPDLIPVYYGTDRATDTQSARLDYTSARADRLHLGCAVLSMPTSFARPPGDRAISLAHEITVQPIPGRDLATQFTVQDIITLTPADLAAQARLQLRSARTFKDQALIFVPGFNTSFDGALFRTAQIVADLDFDGAVFVYSWPSAGRVVQYVYDRDSAAAAAASFRAFVQLVVTQSGAKTVNIIAHGLGAGLTLSTLSTLNEDLPPDVKLGELMFTAPDVERSAFASQIEPLKTLARRTTLYVASTDRSLNISRRFAGLIPRAGDVLETGPFVLTGIDTIDVSAPGTDSVGLNHAAYVVPSAFARDMASRLSQSKSDTLAAAGFTAPERVSSPDGDYHRYRRHEVSQR